MMDGACDIIIEITRVKAEDERVDTTCCVGPFYPRIIISSMLCARGIIVF
jgi:hypothetical protein